ncbi:hypothetical protein PS910_03811 [Pseudomonas fluorescens]|nr:hypothetical protein PS910_03811 [Pseudomonas fluorescens]
MLRNSLSYMEDQRLLASAALFRKLYDNKKDSYDVLAEFIRASINIKGLWNFTVEQCSAALKESFGFQIPAAVLKSCLRKRLKGEVELAHGVFTTTEQFLKSENLQLEIEAAEGEQEEIVSQLVKFVNYTNGRSLTALEDEQLRNDFHKYFLGGLQPGKNLLSINEFILSRSKDSHFTQKLNHLEEGLILYQGIGHSSDTGTVNTWRTSYTIYLDTELLFWANGYDGALFKNLFDEFMDLVREINLKASGTGSLDIKYFPETRREIDSFFSYAEIVVSSGRVSDPSKTAMQHLLNGCTVRSDIVQKKAIFYSQLRKFKISEEDNCDYYNPPDYNLESNNTLTELMKDFPEISVDKISNALKFFSKINYLRKGVSNVRLEQSKAILLSGKNLSRSLAFHSSILQSDGAIPFSTNIEYLTEKLWFKLGKGFGSGTKTPAAFNVVSRAQVIISTQISSKVSYEFKSILSKIESGEMTTNDASYIVEDLRNRSIKPEDLNADNIESITDFLDVDSIEAGIRTKRLLERKAEELEVKSEQLIEANKRLDELKNETLRKQISTWRSGIKNMKISARRYYNTMLLAIALTPVVLLASLTFYLKSDADSTLSLVGFGFTVGAALWPFVSTSFVHGFILRKASSRLRENIRNYEPRPRLDA